MAESADSEIERLRSEVRALRLELEAARLRCDAAEGQMTVVTGENGRLVQQIRDMRQSRSWQVTAPLRLFMRWFRS